MKQISLLRHAKSSWKDAKLKDHDRPLNARGRRDAPWMGKVMAGALPMPDLVLCSTARRARQTILAVCAELGFPAEGILFSKELYMASSSTLLRLIQGLEQGGHVLVCGHNPGLESLASTLCSTCFDKFPTAAVASFAFHVEHWNEVGRLGGRLELFDFPRNHPLEKRGR